MTDFFNVLIRQKIFQAQHSNFPWPSLSITILSFFSQCSNFPRPRTWEDDLRFDNGRMVNDTKECDHGEEYDYHHEDNDDGSKRGNDWWQV